MEPSIQPPDAPPEEIDQPPTDADRQGRAEYVERLSSRQRPKGKKRWPFIVGIVLLVLVAAGAGAYFYIHKNKTAPAATKTAPATSKVAPSNPTTSKDLLTYVSKGQDLNLSFDYPSDWTVTPASGGNTDDKTITLNSPLATMVGADGTATTGKVTVSIRPSSAGLSELASGKAMAAQTSVQFAYKKPSSVQYQYPYLAFVHLTGGSNPKAAFEEVIVSGNTTFNKDDAITRDSLSPDPIISASFYACTTNDCTSTGATPLGITYGTWTNSTIFQQTLALFESLTIQ